MVLKGSCYWSWHDPNFECRLRVFSRNNLSWFWYVWLTGARSWNRMCHVVLRVPNDRRIFCCETCSTLAVVNSRAWELGFERAPVKDGRCYVREFPHPGTSRLPNVRLKQRLPSAPKETCPLYRRLPHGRYKTKVRIALKRTSLFPSFSGFLRPKWREKTKRTLTNSNGRTPGHSRTKRAVSKPSSLQKRHYTRRIWTKKVTGCSTWYIAWNIFPRQNAPNTSRRNTRKLQQNAATTETKTEQLRYNLQPTS